MLGRIREDRPVLSLVVSCILLAMGAALTFAVIVAGASVALASHQNSEEQQPGPGIPAYRPEGAPFQGMITDSRCGPRHLRSSHLNSAECVKACVRKGSSYILVDGDRRYLLVGNEDQLERIAGMRTAISGTREGDTITVSAVAPRF